MIHFQQTPIEILSSRVASARQLLRDDCVAPAMNLSQQVIDQAHASAEPLIGQTEKAAEWRRLLGLESEAGLLLSRAARRASLFDRAVVAIRAALRAAESADLAEAACLAHAEYTHILATLGRNDEALNEANAAFRASARLDGRLDVAAYEALGSVHWMMGQWDDLRDICQRVLALAEAKDATEYCALAHAGLGAAEEGFAMLARGRGDEEQAREHWRRESLHAVACARAWSRLGDVHNVGYAHNMQAVALLGLKEYGASRALLDPFLASLGDKHSARRTLALMNLADVDLAEGALDKAVARLQEAVAACEALGLPYYEAACCEMLSRAYEGQGDLAAALACHRRFNAVQMRSVSETSHTRALAIALVHETELAQHDAKVQRARAERLDSQNMALLTDAARLARDSMEDAMTGIANRRRFDQILQDELNPQSCSLALLDVDHFKQVNDRFSHLVGDQVLRRIGALLKCSCRRTDLAARYGGEEFVLVLDGLDIEEAQAVCERLRRSIETEDWASIDPRLSVTVSIGLAHGSEPGPARNSQALLALADARLYAAKKAGRNRLVGVGGG